MQQNGRSSPSVLAIKKQRNQEAFNEGMREKNVAMVIHCNKSKNVFLSFVFLFTGLHLLNVLI